MITEMWLGKLRTSVGKVKAKDEKKIDEIEDEEGKGSRVEGKSEEVKKEVARERKRKEEEETNKGRERERERESE